MHVRVRCACVCPCVCVHNRGEILRGLRLINWVEESALAHAFLGWQLMVMRTRDALQERQHIFLIANVENNCITGPASLAEQIGPEHGCSLLLLVPLLQPDTSVPLCSTPGSLPLSTLDVGYKEAACGR